MKKELYSLRKVPYSFGKSLFQSITHFSVSLSFFLTVRGQISNDITPHPVKDDLLLFIKALHHWILPLAELEMVEKTTEAPKRGKKLSVVF